MATNIKITALSDITSANMTYNDLLAVVDMNGTAETKKSTVQLMGNLILDGAGGSNFKPANIALTAGTVTTAAQPNITSVGNLTSANVTGNLDAGNVNATTAVVAAYFSGDGANLTNLPAGTATKITDGTSNVDIPTTDGNVTVGVGGTADVLIVTTTGANVAGTLNATGIITGDAGGISNVVYANVTGTPTLGNVSPLNLDGNVSNVLRGDGTFAADSDTAYGDSNVVTLLNAFGSNTITTTGLITGDGGGISNVVAANISGTINLATFAGTANAVAGANVSGEVGFAAVANSVTLANVSGAGNIASINIDGEAGNVLYGNGAFAPVSATTAQTVTTAAQPNITSVGTLTGLNVNGTITAVGITANTGVIAGDGSGLSAIAGANVTGAVTFAGTANAVAGANVSGEVTFAATANAVAYANVSGTPTLGNISTINIDGNSANYLDGTGSFGPVTATTATTAGTVTTAAQPNITSTGTLTSLTVNGALGVTGSGVITGDGGGLSNIPGANLTGTITATTAVLAQEVSQAAQPNIGSVGTLSSLIVSGNITGQSYISATTAIQTTPVVVGSLPAAATAGAGARAFVSDANDTAFNAIVAGAGANNLPVFSDGTNWRIG